MTLALTYTEGCARANAAKSPLGPLLESETNSCVHRTEIWHFPLLRPSRSTCITHSWASALPSECHGLFSSLLRRRAQVNKLNLCNLADGNRLRNPGRLANAALPM